MNILFVYWGIQINDILWGLLELKEQADMYPETINIGDYIQEERELLQAYMAERDYDLVMSANFSQTVAEACHALKVKYAAWVFDSPQIHLYTDSALHEENHIYVFDKIQYERMKLQGIKNLYYQPLAANITRITSQVIRKEDVERFACDISFVGVLYERNNYNLEYASFREETKEYLNAIIKDKALKWNDDNTVFGTLSEENCTDLKSYILPWPEYNVDFAYFYELYYIARKVTEIDRVCILNALALSHQVEIYTGSETYALEKVNVHGKVSYNEELPKIYHLSKINLSLTMRSIESGAPQRVFDIMAAGGFVISNYQKELEELFVPDEEIVLFHSINELIEKVDYYLAHEEERLEIARRGYEKVKKNHQYPIILKRMLKELDG